MKFMFNNEISVEDQSINFCGGWCKHLQLKVMKIVETEQAKVDAKKFFLFMEHMNPRDGLEKLKLPTMKC
jgi:hypothetical protein